MFFHVVRLAAVTLLSAACGVLGQAPELSPAVPVGEEQVKQFLAAVKKVGGYSTIRTGPRTVTATISVIAEKGVTDPGLAKVLSSGVPITSLHLETRLVREATTAAMRRHTETLEEVLLSDVQVSSELAHVLSQCRNLHSLTLLDGGITEEGIVALSRLPRLRVLRLVGLQLNTFSLATLRSLVFLEELSLARSSLPEDSSFLASLPSLLQLDLSEVKEVAPHLRHLKAVPTLQVLKLHLSPVSVDELTALANSALRELEMKSLQITPEMARVLQKFPALRRLALGHSTLTQGALAELCKCAGITELDIQRTKMGKDGLDEFRAMPHLTHLNVTGQVVSTKFLANVADCKLLQVLILQDTKGTDDVVLRLRPLRHLRFLDLSDNAVSNRSLATLREWRTLQKVSLQRTYVTAEGVQQYQKDRPWVDVERE